MNNLDVMSHQWYTAYCDAFSEVLHLALKKVGELVDKKKKKWRGGNLMWGFPPLDPWSLHAALDS